jgi:uncharacterized protein (TIGR03067 family)
MTALLALVSVLMMNADLPGDSDLDKLQGTWVLAKMEVDGEAISPENFKNWQSDYKGNKLTLHAGETVRRRGIVTLEPSRNPKAINTWDQDGPFEDQTVPGIYEIDGDTLKVCFARPGEDRPKEFTTKDNKAFLYCLYQRKKP